MEGTKAKEPQSYLAGYVCLISKTKRRKRRNFWSELGVKTELGEHGRRD